MRCRRLHDVPARPGARTSGRARQRSPPSRATMPGALTAHTEPSAITRGRVVATARRARRRQPGAEIALPAIVASRARTAGSALCRRERSRGAGPYVLSVRSGRSPDRPLDSLLSVHLICAVLHGAGDTTGRTMFTRRGPAVGPAGQTTELLTGPQDVRVLGAGNPLAPGSRRGGESRVRRVPTCMSTCPAELVRESRPSGGWDSGRPAARP